MARLPDLRLERVEGPQAYLLRGPMTVTVTQALGQFVRDRGLQQWLDKQLVDAARANPEIADILQLTSGVAERSRLVGTILHSILQHLPHPDTVWERMGERKDSELDNLAHSYRKWWEDERGHTVVTIASELPVAGNIYFGEAPRLPITGTIDAIWTDPDGKIVVADWKTSKQPSRDHLYQVAMYRELYGADRAEVVYLSKTHKRGKVTVIPLEDTCLWYPVAMGAMKFYGFPTPRGDYD